MVTSGSIGLASESERRDSQGSTPSISPTLVLGLGGTGTDALRHLKRRLVWLWHGDAIAAELAKGTDDPRIRQEEVWRRFEMEGGPPLIQLLAVDTWPWMNRAGQVYLNWHEYAYLGGYNANRVIENLERFPEIKDWWTWDAAHARPGQIHSGARQIRAIGRLSFYRRYREFRRQVEPRIDAMTQIDSRQEMITRGYQVAPEGSTNYVYIIGSLCGGTGAGVFLDVAAAMRDRFKEGAVVVGIFVLPSVFIPHLGSDLQRDRVQANAYAALKELSYFQNNFFRLRLPGEPSVDVPPLFDRIYLLERHNRLGGGLSSREDVFQLIGNQVFLESITDVGSRVREYEVNTTRERHEVEGQVLAYAFSSFANSALVMPAEQVQAYGQLRYAQGLISNGLLRSLSPDEQNQLGANVTAGIGHIVAVLLRDSAGGRGDEEDEEEDEGGQPATPASTTAAGPLEQFVQELNLAAESYGLRGAHEFARRITAAIAERAEASRAQVTKKDKEVQSLNARLKQAETSRSWQERFLIGPLTIFAGRAVRQRRQGIATLRRVTQTAQGELDRLVKVRDQWDRLEKSAGPGLGQIEARIRQLEQIRDVSIATDLGRAASTAGIPDQKTYEMLTVLLGERFIRDTIWPNIEDRPGYAAQLAMDAQALAHDRTLCHFETALAPVQAADTGRYPQTVALSNASIDDLELLVLAAARKAIQTLVRTEEYSIRRILASRESAIQAQVSDLFSRCQPFWRYDLDQGGLSESSLEEQVLVGLCEQSDDTWKYLLRDHPEFYKNRVETNDPGRIEACRIQHGLPIRYLAKLAEYKEKYHEYQRRKAGPLQLSGGWEPDGDDPLPDLLDAGVKKAVSDGQNEDWSQDA